MVGLPDGEKILKICLFVLTQSTNVMAKVTLDASIGLQKSSVLQYYVLL